MWYSGGLGLKSDSKVRVFWVGGNFFDFRSSYIAGKIFFNVLDAVINVIKTALDEHFDGSVGYVADESGQLTAIGRPAGGESKAYALYTAGENYIFGNHFSYALPRISFRVIRFIF